MQKMRYLLVLLLVSLGMMSVSAQTETEEPDPLNAPPQLIVASVLPEDGTQEVAGVAVVTVIFNRPVVPLVIVEDMGNLPQPLRIEPAIEGKGEWLNTSIYVFKPTVIWSPNTDYTITIEAGLTAVDGTVLAEEYVWGFRTVEPRVISVNPRDGENNIALNRTYQLNFNMPMNTASVEAGFIMQKQGSDDLVEGTFEWNTDNTGFRFIPSEQLELDSTYRVSIAGGLVLAASGEKPMPSQFRATFSTVPYPRIVGSEPRNGSAPSSIWDVNILFNTRMRTESFRGLITIDPAPAREPELYFYSWDNSLSISFFLQPSTEYTITLAPGAEDPYGNKIDEEFTFSFTSPPYRPSINLRTTGEIGFYNAYNPQTNVFATHLNVSYLDLALYDVSLAEFAIDALNPDYYSVTDRLPRGERSALKRWQIESVAPPNMMRFELLNLGEGLNLQEGTDALPPGVYLLTITSPETRREGWNPQKHLVVVGTANLTTKTNLNEVVVWAVDVQSGAPIPNAPITLYGQGYEVVSEGTTDADGMVRLSVPRGTDVYSSRYMAVLKTDDQFGVGLTTWSDGIESYNFGVPGNYYPLEYSVYLYTDRPIYRPGQPVYFRGVIRNQDDVTYTLPDMTTVPVKIFDESGGIVYEKELELTPYGTFSDTFNIASESGLGTYRIAVELPSRHRWYSEGGSVVFAVAEYRLPEFQVTTTAVEPQVVQGDTILVDVASRYFFGGLVTNADVSYSVVAEPFNFPYKGKGYWDFYDYDPDGGPSVYYSYSGGWIADGEGKTDARGEYQIELPADLKDSTLSQVFRIEATVSDESQQAVSSRTEVVVHKGELYVGARPQRYVGTANQEAAFEFIAVEWDSTPIANQTLNVRVVERRWSSVQEEDPNGRTIWTWEMEEIPVTDGTVTTNEDGYAVFNYTPPYGGVFKAIVTTSDGRGNDIRSATTMWVSSREYVSWRQQNSNRIDLIASQRDFSVGDEAEILITSPFQGTTEALITIERGSVLSIERITMDSNSYVYRFPILPEYAPNIFVSVLLIKGVDENTPVAGFRMGLLTMNVDINQKALTLEITPNVEQAGPGDTVTYTIRTTNYLGEGVPAEVGVGLTDLASLSISSPNSRPLLQHFYSTQGLGVLTGLALTINVDQLTREVLDTIKGGGGGPGDGGIFDIRQEFVDTAYWNATLVTDENGLATFDVVMPDNLTTWRLDARAIGQSPEGVLLVGQDTFDLISTKPLLIRPVTTRFMVIGDLVTLSAVVNNNTDDEQTVIVEVLANGVTLQDDARKVVTISAGGRARITWQALVEDVQAIDLTFFAMSEDGAFTDASKPPLGQGDARTLPVYRYEAPEMVGTGGLLRDAETRTEAIVLPERFAIYEGELTIRTEHSLASTAVAGLDYLDTYYNFSAEGIISAFVPNILVYRALESLGLNDLELRANLDSRIEDAIQRLYALQKVDGGWGWFFTDDSNPTVTAWALIGLQTAKEYGFPVSARVMERAQTFLRENLINASLSVATWQLNRQAFILYALAYSGAPNIASMSTLFDARERMSIYAKALLARALHLSNGDEGRISTLVSDVMNAAILSANGAHWEEGYRDYRNWNTNTRTTAMVLGMLVQLRPDNELIPNVVRYLMVMRQADAWRTTQETVWSLMALTDWMVVSEELKGEYDYTVSFNGDEIVSERINATNVTSAQTTVIDVAEMLRGEANMLTFDRTDGRGNLYYTAYLRVNLPVPEIEPLDRGIIINRRYTLANDPTNTPITQARIGELVRVRLTVIIPNSLHYVVIEDPIPAGADAVNPNLQTSQQLGTRPSLNSQNPLSRGWGWWYFSNIQFYDEKVVLSSTYLPAGTYEYVYTIRPGLEGVYNVIPPIGYEFYFPDVYGRGAGSSFTILPMDE